jgi:hypothetical protein
MGGATSHCTSHNRVSKWSVSGNTHAKTFAVKLISWFAWGTANLFCMMDHLKLEDKASGDIYWSVFAMKILTYSDIFGRLMQPGWLVPRSAIYAAVCSDRGAIYQHEREVLVWSGEPLWVHSEYLMRVNTAGGISVAWQTCRAPTGGISHWTVTDFETLSLFPPSFASNLPRTRSKRSNALPMNL